MKGVIPTPWGNAFGCGPTLQPGPAEDELCILDLQPRTAHQGDPGGGGPLPSKRAAPVDNRPSQRYGPCSVFTKLRDPDGSFFASGNLDHMVAGPKILQVSVPRSTAAVVVRCIRGRLLHSFLDGLPVISHGARP